MNTENGPACEPEMGVLNAGVRVLGTRERVSIYPLFSSFQPQSFVLTS